MASLSCRIRPSSFASRINALAKASSIQTSKYHSYNHPAPPGPFSETESLILSTAVPYIPTHGFTEDALHLGAKSAGYLDASVNLFPQGAFSLVHYYLYTQRQALQNQTSIINPPIEPGHKPLGVGAKVKALTWARLMANEPVIHRYQDALALMSSYPNITTSVKELGLLSDEIWFLAGDVSVDSSWYTKRASLSAIFGATELFMTTDKSEGFKETKEFLDRRFEDSRVIGTAARDVGEWVSFTAGAAVNVLRSKGVRI